MGLTYSDWAAQAITGGLPAGQNDDADDDGLVNVLEFVLNTDPMVADGSDAFTVESTADGILVSHSLRAGISGVQAKFQTSEDLSSWSDFTGASTTANGRVHITLPAGMQGHARLSVE